MEAIRISIREWGLLTGDKHPDFTLVSYGMKDSSQIVRKLVTRRKADGAIFVATTGAMFQEDTDWDSDYHLTTLYPAVERVVYDLPRL